jgi:hypothetical protein
MPLLAEEDDLFARLQLEVTFEQHSWAKLRPFDPDDLPLERLMDVQLPEVVVDPAPCARSVVAPTSRAVLRLGRR